MVNRALCWHLCGLNAGLMLARRWLYAGINARIDLLQATESAFSGI
jgi:hypothetical protein